MKKWEDGEKAVLMNRVGKERPFHGIALMKVHIKENAYNPDYPKLSAETTADIYGNAYRDYRQELSSVNAYTYKEAIAAIFKYGVTDL